MSKSSISIYLEVKGSDNPNLDCLVMACMQPSGMYGANPKWVEARFAPMILGKANNC